MLESNAKLVPKGAILIAMYGSIGKLGIAGIECATNQAIAFTTAIEKGIDNKYLFYSLLNIRKDLLNLGKGGTQANISQTVLKKVPVPIAPLEEQRRIVLKLEQLLTKINNCKERLDRIPALLKHFRQSVLAAACSGRLTTDWRERNLDMERASELLKRIRYERLRKRWYGQKSINVYSAIENFEKVVLYEIPSSWEWTFLVEFHGEEQLVLTGPFGTTLGKDDFQKAGVPVITIGCLKDAGLLLEKALFVSQQKADELSRYKVKKDDLLFSRMGTVGKAAKVTEELEGALINYHIMRLRLPNWIAIDYFLYVIKGAKSTPLFLKEINHGVTRDGIKTQELLGIPIPLPPLEEQHEIVRRVEALFKIADQIEARYEKAKSYVDRLTQAILAKAFRGELVPQDPDDEPASVLLARIRKERARREAELRTARHRRQLPARRRKKAGKL